MFFKFILYILCAPSILQISHVLAQSNSKSVADDVESALNRIREDVIDAITLGLSGEYTVMSQLVDDTFRSTLSNATSTINAKATDFLAQYTSIMQTAEDSGVNVTECFDSFDSRFKNLASDNVEGLQNCLQNQIEPTVEYMYYWSAAFTREPLKDYVYAHEKKILYCMQDEDCLDEVLAGIAEDSDALSSRIDDIIEEHVNGLNDFLTKITNCGELYAAATNGIGKGMLNGCQICIESQNEKNL